MLIEEKEEIGHIIYVENKTIQPKTVGRKKKNRRIVEILQKSAKNNREQ